MNAPFYLWRGFEHDWLRKALGFSTPHRIRKLDSLISQAPDAARFHFGQASGVDGNYMRPVGHFACVEAPGVRVEQHSATLAWTDELDGGPFPQARSDREHALSIDLSGSALRSMDTVHAVLSGFRLRSVCDPARQPPDNPRNSDGMWPFKLWIEVAPCHREGDTLTCPIRVQVHRAWTPMLGGLPPFEIKPLNARLDIEVEVALTVIGGASDQLHVTSAPALSTSSPANRGEPSVVTAGLRGVEGFPVAVSALRGFGFELRRRSARASHGHLGRYLGGLRFNLRDGDYDATTGTLDVDHVARVWTPITVVPSNVVYRMESALIQLGPGAQVDSNREVRGQLCCNSTEQAPFFSRWCRCGDAERGPEQDEMSVALRG